MEQLVKFIQKTNQLASILEAGLPNEGREDYIQSIHDLLGEREQILKSLPDLSNKLDENVKQQLVNLEKNIYGIMLEQQNMIKKDLQVLQLKKKKNNEYAEPYENVSIDGMFLDKKK
ncbi:MAG TPA: hypothetical protein GX497_13150 [Bacillus bacterium]|nr:hypothetical protein [Bacillus sp. (in: firmicutes)]